MLILSLVSVNQIFLSILVKCLRCTSLNIRCDHWTALLIHRGCLFSLLLKLILVILKHLSLYPLEFGQFALLAPPLTLLLLPVFLCHIVRLSVIVATVVPSLNIIIIVLIIIIRLGPFMAFFLYLLIIFIENARVGL